MEGSVLTAGNVSGTVYKYVEKITNKMLATQMNVMLAPWLFHNYGGKLEHVGGRAHVRLEPEVGIGSGEDIEAAGKGVITKIIERTAALNTLEQRHAAFAGLSNLEKTLYMDPMRFNKWVATAGVNMAHVMDSDCWDVYHHNVGLTFADTSVLMSAPLFEFACGKLHEVPLPMGNKRIKAVIRHSDFGNMKKAFGGPVVQDDSHGSGGGIYFNERFLKPMSLKDAYNGTLYNHIDIMSTQQIPPYESGKWTAAAGGIKVRGANQTGDEIDIDGLTDGSKLYAGAAFKIAGVFFVNMKTKMPIMQATFTVREEATADANGRATVKISPEINAGNVVYTTGRTANVSSNLYNNVNAAPADDAAITIIGNSDTMYAQAFMFNEMGIYRRGMEFDPLYLAGNSPHEMIKHVSFGQGGKGGLGFSMSCIADVDAKKRQSLIRFDALQACSMIRPMYTARIIGAAFEQSKASIKGS